MSATLPCGHPKSDETSADSYTFCGVCAVGGPPAEPRAMQVWRGRGAAHEQKLLLTRVSNGRVTFERIASPRHHLGVVRLHRSTRCLVEQLLMAFEYEREAEEADLG
jgi:hypothetical protein